MRATIGAPPSPHREPRLPAEQERALEEARRDPKLANVLYHDAAARSYDRKWAIGFDERCLAYVRERAERMLPRRRYDRVLEIGVGTGFFLLNLWRAGFVGEAHACDLSTGMLEVCGGSARAMGCDVHLRVADAEDLPYPKDSFDLVVGHAILHHLPEPERALSELHRVLVPGGDLAIAGEPTTLGDRMAKAAGRVTVRSVRAARRHVRWLDPAVSGSPVTDDERIMKALEWDVDLHTFGPEDLRRSVRRAGFEQVRVETEELASSVVGWAIRTFEHEVPAFRLGPAWASFAYRTYRILYALDQRVLYRLLPMGLFYNALVYGRKARGAAEADGIV